MSGGPSFSSWDKITVDMSKKKIYVDSKKCFKAVILIQKKWKGYYQKKIYETMVEKHRIEMEKDF